MQPLVSVRIATYNHEGFVAQCLESVLMQKTDFPFEIIIGEDCSTDRTKEIVSAYQKEYPDKIKAIFSPRNLGVSYNSRQIQLACRGKYHAICEGDDYWIDPMKLQKQVDILEANPALSLSFHNAFILNKKSFATRLLFENEMKPTLNFAEACRISPPTASVMARSEILETLPPWRTEISCGDVLLRLWCAHHGDLAYLDEVMSVYRIHKGGITSRRRPMVKERYTELFFIYRQFDQETHLIHAETINDLCRQARRRMRIERFGVPYLLFSYLLFSPKEFMVHAKKNIVRSRRQMRLFRTDYL